MIIKRVAMAALTGEAVWAVHGWRRKVGGAIERHSEVSAKDTTRRQQALVFQALQNLNQHRLERTRQEGIEELADLIVTGNLLHASQRLGVIVSFAVLQSALGRQKRRGWGEKEAKGAQGGIVDSISWVGTRLAMVRQLTDLSGQDVLENIAASGRDQDDLLGSGEFITLSISVSMGKIEPLACQNANCWENTDDLA